MISAKQRDNIKTIIKGLGNGEEHDICVGYEDGSSVCKEDGLEPCYSICHRIFPEIDITRECPSFSRIEKEEIIKRFRSIL